MAQGTHRVLWRELEEKTEERKYALKPLMNPGLLLSAAVMSFSSQVHLLKGVFNNRKVCAPKSYPFPSSCTSWTNKRYYHHLHIFSFSQTGSSASEKPSGSECQTVQTKASLSSPLQAFTFSTIDGKTEICFVPCWCVQALKRKN